MYILLAVSIGVAVMAGLVVLFSVLHERERSHHTSMREGDE